MKITCWAYDKNFEDDFINISQLILAMILNFEVKVDLFEYY